MKKLLLITLFALSLTAELLESKVVEETKEYTIFCIKETLWIKWNNSYSPVQMFRLGASATPIWCE